MKMPVPPFLRHHGVSFVFALLLGLVMTPAAQAARKARAILVQPTGQVFEKAFLVSTGGVHEIELPQRNFSPEIELPDGELALKVLSAKPEGENPIPEGAPSVRIPESWTRCLLIFIPDPANTVAPFRVLPVNASTTDFPPGNTVVYNLSEALLAAKLGEQVLKINPRGTAVFKAPVSGFGSYDVAIDSVMPGDERPTALCRSTWQHDPEARQIMFVVPVSGQKLPRIWGILDREVKNE